jgi:chromosome segregation ATPase
MSSTFAPRLLAAQFDHCTRVEGMEAQFNVGMNMLQKIIQRHEQQAKQQADVINCLHSDVLSACADSADHRHALLELELKHAAKRQELRQSNALAINLGAAIVTAESTIAFLEKQFSDVSARLQDADSEIAGFKEEVALLESMMQSQDNALCEADTALAAQTSRADDAETRALALKAMVKQQALELDAARARESHLQTALDNAHIDSCTATIALAVSQKISAAVFKDKKSYKRVALGMTFHNSVRALCTCPVHTADAVLTVPPRDSQARQGDSRDQ